MAKLEEEALYETWSKMDSTKDGVKYLRQNVGFQGCYNRLYNYYRKGRGKDSD